MNKQEAIRHLGKMQSEARQHLATAMRGNHSGREKWHNRYAALELAVEHLIKYEAKP